MPLCLNTPDPTLDLRKRIIWNPESADEVLEAQAKIDDLRKQGFEPVQQPSPPGEMVLEPPARDSGLFLVRILDDSGDTRLVWNRKNHQEIEDARKKFDEYISKGYRAYVCRWDGSKGSRVESFDSLLEEIIMVEKKLDEHTRVGEKRKPAEAVMVPPTAPG